MKAKLVIIPALLLSGIAHRYQHGGESTRAWKARALDLRQGAQRRDLQHHKYATSHGHAVLPKPRFAIEKQLVAIQEADSRRSAAQWIPLNAATKPTVACTQDGRSP